MDFDFLENTTKPSGTKPTLFLIRGVPGSGKSTLAVDLFNSGMVALIFEADQYFYDNLGNYNFDASKLGVAHRHCQEKTRYALSQGWSVAVSNTSTKESEVKVYEDIAKELGVTFVSLIVENRHNGVNQHNVPEEKIKQMKDRFSVKL